MGLLAVRKHQLKTSSKLPTTWSSSRGSFKQTKMSLTVLRSEKMTVLHSVAVMEVILVKKKA